ncbi:Hypothetical protein, putative [Bodo saltans]|uniref:Fatty acid hydroxylase domain-containing protein n=1 Tax=Bodo saltans TaxID=75058 RepID=A0A0S4IZK1_BODSA|nr:Hypothetical protein, putative [Bodo saltans]|eukprot:CUG67619.1 Hypothetical protein, putative [Bodo saltans]
MTPWVPDCLLSWDVDIGQQALFDGAFQKLLAFTGGDLRLVYVIFLTVAHSLPTILINGTHYLIRLVLGDAALEPYRWQAGRQPPPALVRKCIMYVGAAHILSPLLPYSMFPRAYGYHPHLFSAPVPGILTLLLQYVVAFLFTDGIFYWTHRLLHTPMLYRWIHKQHHQFYVTIGLAAEYAHPIELLFGNVLPVFFASVVFRYHIAAFSSWVFIAMAGTTFHHSGFFFPLAPSDEFHDFHHSHVVCNFGSSPMWDWLCGTDKQWQDKRRGGSVVKVVQQSNTDVAGPAVLPPLSLGTAAVVAVPRGRAARSPSPAKSSAARRKRSTSRK